MTHTVVLPFPPSVNTYYRTVQGRMLISAKGRQYRKAVEDLAMFEAWPRLGTARLGLHIEAWMPDKRRRDLDNLLKSALDALAYAKVYEDDSQIDRLCVERYPLVGGMLKVRIEVMEAA